MRTASVLVSAAAFAGMAIAAPVDSTATATIVIEASHGGAGSGLTNTTISVPIGPIYTNSDALDEVSTLYLTGATGVDVTSVTCTPYQATDGEGTGGLPFTSSQPSYLSTNTVVVGSIVCESS
ncbi:hypothetical protein PFICI_05388 [Pestalotiopsis fici W106-1]|uniref:Uncharacterized protein n=1 Tax=Pestalotiopsis fici (strain W106-1 / CGMCC3.15140) TaxID=1229662 RepID=W3XDL3_PESFW|nr:uncharacterized protein PFICI_05388 [Pestalotiopsis fici W106-1]ETS83512.1 hypothetical protein PFICI_05388 [Pestalotiopsis fici W106-1]